MPGNNNKLIARLTNPEGKKITGLKVRTMHLTKDERSMLRRRRLARSTTAIDQMERMHIYSADALSLKGRARIHFPTLTNKGNWLGPIIMPAWSMTWQLTFGDKKDRNALCMASRTAGNTFGAWFRDQLISKRAMINVRSVYMDA